MNHTESAYGLWSLVIINSAIFIMFAFIFGGGASAFSEYERGKTQPHKSTVILLELLGKHPELMSEVRALADERTRFAA